MRTRPLGRTGIQVSPYCLDTMMFGRVGNRDHDDCVRIVQRAAGRHPGGAAQAAVRRACRGVRR
ncbi:hypothetical protein [Nonomuraea sp. GTA35]|uniref:hypothetical protein n=1 Tax=Nonomuraea sp. GTA35 TaxID=1676746 RepID=UPI0035C17A49